MSYNAEGEFSSPSSTVTVSVTDTTPPGATVISGVSSGTTGNNWTYDLISYTDGALASQQENTK